MNTLIIKMKTKLIPNYTNQRLKSYRHERDNKFGEERIVSDRYCLKIIE